MDDEGSCEMAVVDEDGDGPQRPAGSGRAWRRASVFRGRVDWSLMSAWAAAGVGGEVALRSWARAGESARAMVARSSHGSLSPVTCSPCAVIACGSQLVGRRAAAMRCRRSRRGGAAAGHSKRAPA